MSSQSERWLAEFEGAEQLGQEIMELINERNSLQRSGSNAIRTQTLIRTKLQQFSKTIKMLKDSLNRETSLFTSQEAERRQYQIDCLISKEKQLNSAFKPSNTGNSGDAGREGLLNQGFDLERNDMWGRGGGGAETNVDLTPGGFQQRQDQIIAEQDKGLDALSQVIQRQKLMGQAIGEEIDYQNELIDDIADGVDRTKEKLIRTENRVKKVTKKAGSCGLLVVIVLLFVVIVIVSVVPN